MPEDLREPLARHFLLRHSQESIASDLGITRSAVSRRIARAIEKVRKTLKRDGVPLSSAGMAALMTGGFTEAAALPSGLSASLGAMAVSGAAKSGAVGAGIAAGALAAKVIPVVVGAVVVLGCIWFLAKGTPALTSPHPSFPISPARDDSFGSDDNAVGAGSVLGSVRNGVTQEFLPGVGLELRSASGRIWRAQTGLAAEFAFQGLDPGRYVLTVRSPTELVKRNSGALARPVAVKAGSPTRVDFSLDGGATYGGVVVDATTRRAISGASIAVVGQGHSRGFAESGADGRFYVAMLQGGQEHRITVTTASHLPLGKEVFLPEGGLRDDTVVLVQGATIQGKVVLSNNQPVDLVARAGSIRVVLEDQQGLDLPFQSSKTPGSNANGTSRRFRFSPLPVGTYVLKGQCGQMPGSPWDGKVFCHDQALTIRKPGQVVEADLVLPFDAAGTGSIEGWVVTADGQPISGAAVSLKDYPLVPQQATDAKGRFAIPDLLMGMEVDLVAGFYAYDFEEREAGPTQTVVPRVPVGEKNLRIVLSQSGSIVGLAVDAGTGNALPEAEVEVVPEKWRDEANQPRPTHPVKVVNQSLAGGFAVQFLTPGFIPLRIKAPGYYPVQIDGVRIESGKTTDIGMLQRRYSTIVVAAPRHAGTMPIFQVSLRGSTGEVTGYIENSGQHELEQIYLTRSVERWPYEANETNVNDRYYEDPTALWLVAQQSCPASGSFRFGLLPADSYTVHVVYRKLATGERAVSSQQISVADGEATDLVMKLDDGTQ